MTSDNSKTKLAASAGHGLFVLFLLFLWLPTVDALFKTDHTQTTHENRAMAAWPQWDGHRRGLQNYLKGLENYFNDHFGYRKRLVRWNNRWRNNWFHEASHPNVTEGQDGWLYFVGYRVIENYHLGESFTPAELQAWQTLFETRQAWLKHRGIKYQVVLVPIKSTVYPEYLPAWLTKSPRPAKLDQFMEHMKAHSTVPVLDLRPTLRAAKTNAFVYLNTDSHWNKLGAFVSYQEIVKCLGSQFPGMQPLPQSAFSCKELPDRPGQDLAAMLGLENQFREKHFYEFQPLPPLLPVKHGDAALAVNLLLKSPTGVTVTEYPAAHLRAVVYHDSYAPSLFDFLGYHFNWAAWFSRPGWQPEVIEKLKPDVVIDERAEYGFFILDPHALLQDENLQQTMKPRDAAPANVPPAPALR